jgi:hypothetical protein
LILHPLVHVEKEEIGMDSSEVGKAASASPTAVPASRGDTCDWRVREHAEVTGLLVQELFSRGIWRVAKWVVVAIVTFAVAVAIVLIAAGEGREAAPLIPLLIIICAILLRFSWLTGWIRARQTRGHDPNINDPFTQIYSEDGLHVATRTASADLKWSGMFKVRETRDYLLFYYSRRMAYYLPKRAVPNDEDLAELRSRIRAWAPETPVELDG